MAERTIAEYGDQMWSKNRGRIEFFDEDAEAWLRWDPGKHENMPPPSFFRKRRGHLFARATDPRTLRIAFWVFAITGVLWIITSGLYILTLLNHEWSQDLYIWIASAGLVANASWQVALGAILATVALLVATTLGNRPLFTGDDYDVAE